MSSLSESDRIEESEHVWAALESFFTYPSSVVVMTQTIYSDQGAGWGVLG